ncbi:MAG: hypothetical protein Q7S52_02965 [bacterium]|nr:hypothetical protein [bacterium]
MRRAIISFVCCVLAFCAFSAMAADERAVADDSAHTANAKVLWENSSEQSATAYPSYRLSGGMTAFFLFTGVLSCALAGFMIVRSQKRELRPADEYAIIEDIIEGADDD